MKVFLRTYGCQMNERDSENIAAQFIERGCEITDDERVADICIVNTCSVREQAEQKAIGKLGHLIDLKIKNTENGELVSAFPVVGITGCMAQNLGEKLSKILPEIDFVLGARKTPYVVDTALEIAAERAASKDFPMTRAPKRRDRKSLAKVDISDDLTSHNLITKHDPRRLPETSSFVSIMQGCGMKCSYCIVPKVRGEQRSRPVEDIVREIKFLAERGTKEITLLGQVVNAYGRDFGEPRAFSELLKRVNDIDGIERIRFTSPHPAYFREDLISLYGSLEKLCEHVHLPLQSGSDEILRRMKRPYTSEKFAEVADKLRERVKNISISTDIIVGYPQETESQFEDTAKMFERCRFDMAYIFKYSPRAGTPSADTLADDVSEAEKERRNQRLLDILARISLEFNESLVGQKQQVLVEGRAKRGENMFMGRTRSHRKVIFEASESDIGKLLYVGIESASVSALCGKVCDG